MPEQQYVEIFHLLFMKQLGEQLSKEHYALKGGCNLRFYLKSIRYSEDIDFDVKTIAKETLKSKVRKILKSSSFTKILDARGITMVDTSETKQTDTTQRWKITLKTTSGEIPIHTKIEFSRRNLDDGAIFEAVDSELVYGYGLYPIYSTHYNKDTAFKQKINALIHRPETQARDIFDLGLLLKAGVNPAAPPGVDNEGLQTAQNNALAVSYSNFTGQVLAYLLPGLRANYNEVFWNGIVEKIVGLLEKLKS